VTASADRLLLRLFAAVLVALGFLPVANLVAHGPYIPWWPAAVRDWTTTGLGILLVAWLLALLLGERLAPWGARLASATLRPSPRVFLALLAVAAVALTGAAATYCFARSPFTQDELAQRFHAHLLLAGHLYARGEAHPEFFSAAGVLAGARITSQFPIGGPALLAVGMAFHVVWLVNPLLTALTVRNIYRFTADAFGEGAARATAILFLLSPFVLIMGGSEMNHVGALALGTLALAALPAWATATQRRKVGQAAAVIGLSLGGLAAIRPLDAVAVAVVIGAFQLSVVLRDRDRWSSLLSQVGAAAVPIALLLFANARTTGHPLMFAYSALYGPHEAPGFHTDPLGGAHTPAHGLLLASANLMRLNRFLFQWPLPGLLPVVVAALALRRASRWDMLLVGLGGAVVLAYALYWSDGFLAGPRFMYIAVPVYVIFAARAPGLLTARLGGVVRRAVYLVIPLCVLWAWFAPTGVSSAQMTAYFYHRERAKLKSDIEPVVRKANLRRALVFVNEGWRARLEARLRALGLRPGEAERILQSSDACQIQRAVEAEDARTPPDTAGRWPRLREATRPSAPLQPVPGLAADQSLLVAEGSRLTPGCLAELHADTAGVAPFAPFLELEGLETDGSFGGNVVFVRDFGNRNEVLRARFPDRGWYRYRPPRFLGDTTAAIVPYSPRP
jgi:hypothetical protein